MRCSRIIVGPLKAVIVKTAGASVPAATGRLRAISACHGREVVRGTTLQPSADNDDNSEAAGNDKENWERPKSRAIITVTASLKPGGSSRSKDSTGRRQRISLSSPAQREPRSYIKAAISRQTAGAAFWLQYARNQPKAGCCTRFNSAVLALQS